MYDVNRDELLKRISEVQFAAIELTLFLDNHPEDQAALQDYNVLAQDLKELFAMHEAHYGPLMAFGCGLSKFPWQWVDEPWPWESGE
jgi:spore coat protein JB